MVWECKMIIYSLTIYTTIYLHPPPYPPTLWVNFDALTGRGLKREIWIVKKQLFFNYYRFCGTPFPRFEIPPTSFPRNPSARATSAHILLGERILDSRVNLFFAAYRRRKRAIITSENMLFDTEIALTQRLHWHYFIFDNNRTFVTKETACKSSCHFVTGFCTCHWIGRMKSTKNNT